MTHRWPDAGRCQAMKTAARILLVCFSNLATSTKLYARAYKMEQIGSLEVTLQQTDYENMSMQSSGHGQGDCVDANGHYFDSWYAANLSYEQCTSYCTADNLCLGITHRASDGNCELRFSEGTLPTNSPDSTENCSTQTYTYMLVYNDTWCGSSSPRSDERSTNLSMTECEASCSADPSCNFIMYGHDTTANDFRCATFFDCNDTHHFAYNDGDPHVYEKRTTESSVPLCPNWQSWTGGMGTGPVHRVQGKSCHKRDWQYNYSLLYTDKWCGNDAALTDQIISDNISECEALCNAEPQCKFFVFGHDDGYSGTHDHRCSTFSTCDVQYTYENGDPNVYEKQGLSSSTYVNITPYGTDAGCVDSQDRHFDALWKENTSYADCEAACTTLDACLGLDVVNSTGYCELEFDDGTLPTTQTAGFTEWTEGTGTGGIAKVHDGEGRLCYRKVNWPTPSVTGDPHLTNAIGQKFDIHDGTHRLVHYPRGAPEQEALLMVDAQAVDMGQSSNCYSVYLQSIKLFGSWVGEDVIINAHTNPSVVSSDPSAFSMSFAGERMDWPTLSKQQDTRLKLKGSMPVTFTTSLRSAFGEDTMGGEEINLKVGDYNPVTVQIWSSHGKNPLTRNKEVRYLNMEVQNLPKNSGGIIGLDSYSRPSTSHCDLVKEEQDLLDFISQNTADVNLLRIASTPWTVSATIQN